MYFSSRTLSQKVQLIIVLAEDYPPTKHQSPKFNEKQVIEI